MGEKLVLGGDDLHVPDHATVHRDHRSVAGVSRSDVLEGLSEDLMEKPGALGAREAELAALGAVGVEQGAGAHGSIVPNDATFPVIPPLVAAKAPR